LLEKRRKKTSGNLFKVKQSKVYFLARKQILSWHSTYRTMSTCEGEG